MGETRESLEEELIRLCREIESSIVTIKGIISKAEAAAEQQRAVEHVKKKISTAKNVCQALRADQTPLAPSQEEIFNLRWLMYHDNIVRYEQDLALTNRNYGTPTEDRYISDDSSTDSEQEEWPPIKSPDAVIIIPVERTTEDPQGTFHHQSNDLHQTEMRVEEVKLTAKQANHHLRILAGRFGTEKLFMIFMLLLFLGIVAVVTISIVHKRDNPRPSPAIIH
ncbi:hypothetical protein PROFUN_12235 [Planoprotostelium fungivorum]|uniref:Uncharacterized protein n=1 Tax=Planoprotostelium fungivorum TaxID=1890364 RepID=A0A2P6N877_9EUKA|nr:hypothetical protein PROFUN_12235 [Planoprotostelium fungivorum]